MKPWHRLTDVCRSTGRKLVGMYGRSMALLLRRGQKLRKELSERLSSYADTEKAKDWLDENWQLVRELFEDVSVRDFVFEPFRDVFKDTETDSSRKILSTITQVAIANAVLAGLPGKMGIGVLVSMGLEAWMALTIARAIGVKIESPNDIWTYFGLLAGVAGTVLYLFRHLLGFAFSLFSVIPMLPSTVLAELVITNFVGILFWFGFEEARKTGSFTIPSRMLTTFKKRFGELYDYQKDLVRALLRRENVKLVGKRLKTWLSGDMAVDRSAMRGEMFAFAAMAYLIQGKYDSLQGPLGAVFVDSIRRAYSSKLGGASVQEMSDFFSERTQAQLSGDINLVKGEMFEHLVEQYENADGDKWEAELHDDRTVPGSDIIMSNSETGEEVEVSLKATDNPELIENALKRYPDTPILTTEEMEAYYGDHPSVWYSQFSDEELEQVTEDNFEALANQLEPISSSEVASGGVFSRALFSLWPFVIAYARKRISQEQLQKAMVRVLGESGVSLASRVSYAIILGPIFAWYLLARAVLLIIQGAEHLSKHRKVLVQV